jgi:hypothetical protein
MKGTPSHEKINAFVTQEVQLEINTGLLDSFESVENDDRGISERLTSLWKRDSEITMFSFMPKNEGSNSPNSARNANHKQSNQTHPLEEAGFSSEGNMLSNDHVLLRAEDRKQP